MHTHSVGQRGGGQGAAGLVGVGFFGGVGAGNVKAAAATQNCPRGRRGGERVGQRQGGSCCWAAPLRGCICERGRRHAGARSTGAPPGGGAGVIVPL